MARRHRTRKIMLPAFALVAGFSFGSEPAGRNADDARVIAQGDSGQAQVALLVPKRTRLIINYRRCVLA